MVGVKRVEKSGKDELKVEVGMNENLKKKLVRSSLKWAGHRDEKIGEKVEGKRRRDRPRMRWEDCVKRDLERMGGEWRTTAKDRRSWRMVIENAVRET